MILLDNTVGKNFKAIMKETFEKIYSNSKQEQNNKVYVIYGLTVTMIVFSLALNFLGI